MTPRKLLKRPTNGRNKKSSAIGILTIFGKGSAAREAEDVAEGIEETTITTDALPGNLGLRHLDGAAHIADTSIALHHQDVMLILIFQAAEMHAV